MLNLNRLVVFSGDCGGDLEGGDGGGGGDGDGGVDAGGEHINEPLSQPVCSSRCEQSGQSGSLLGWGSSTWLMSSSTGFHLKLIWITADLGETSIKSAPSIWTLLSARLRRGCKHLPGGFGAPFWRKVS